MNRTYRTHWYSERHLLISPCDAAAAPACIRAFAHALHHAQLPGIRDLTPAASTLLVHLDPAASPEEVLATIITRLDALDPQSTPAPMREVEIPFCSTSKFAPDLASDLAPDLAWCAQHSGLSIPEFLARFCSLTFEAAFVGFMPGFAYLSGLDPTLHVPRLPSPRQRVPAGSIAIAGDMAGIYPFASPGGWRLIGRTPHVMFDPARAQPALIEAGCRVRFTQIDHERFESLVREQERQP